MRVKKGRQLHNLKVQGEVASPNVEAAASYPADLSKIINESSHTNNRFSIFYWKKMSSRTFTASKKSMPGFKASKDKMILLLRDNVAGDFKLKPMLIYHSHNLRTLMNYAKSNVLVLYKWNNAWMTAYQFTVF